MFIISGEIYEDEEIVGNFEECEEEVSYEPYIDAYTMLSFVIQERFNTTTVLCF